MSSSKQPPSKLNGGAFECVKKIGAGCFGEVFQGVQTSTKELVAIKFEDLNARGAQLEHESQVLRTLAEPSRPQGVAELFYFGQENRHRCMVIELLGKSLEDRMEGDNGRFSVKTAVLVAEQLLHRIEYLHSKCIVHRDIKPENFMFGRDTKKAHLYAIDFGLSKRYWHTQHVAPKTKLSLTGTARYASINAHLGCEQSRRDDLEAIGHMLFYFIRGKLPWSGLAAKTQEEKYRKICEKKQEVSVDSLCDGFPDCFKEYLKAARKLEFKEKPDYVAMRKLFQEVRKQLQEEDSKSIRDHEFQWFEGKELGELIPLSYSVCKQPDDSQQVASKPGAWFCGFCGSTAKVRD